MHARLFDQSERDDFFGRKGLRRHRGQRTTGRPKMVITHLKTPPMPQLVPRGVFDAFAWCKSDRLEWRRPNDRWDVSALDRAENPSGMTFIMRDGAGEFLPRELARLHALGYGLSEEWALAPYGIDDATDLLFERKARPNETLWLAADGLRALAWGLHDWAHFHNHGSFEERAWTELQCDASALVWLWINRETIPNFDDAAWDRVHAAMTNIARQRFVEEEKPFDEAVLARDHLFAMIEKSS
ncbi:MAG: hypothetical protein ABI461_10240, partial [Polyangiaceae bacterium]